MCGLIRTSSGRFLLLVEAASEEEESFRLRSAILGVFLFGPQQVRRSIGVGFGVVLAQEDLVKRGVEREKQRRERKEEESKRLERSDLLTGHFLAEGLPKKL
jgi:hypothetical protein